MKSNKDPIEAFILGWLDQPLNDTKTLMVIFEDGELGTIARVSWKELAHQLRLLMLGEREKSLGFFTEDIVHGFIPKCSYCGRKTAKVVGQTAKGQYAQENHHRPVNWGYYCQRCYDEGIELEREAMYG